MSVFNIIFLTYTSKNIKRSKDVICLVNIFNNIIFTEYQYRWAQKIAQEFHIIILTTKASHQDNRSRRLWKVIILYMLLSVPLCNSINILVYVTNINESKQVNRFYRALIFNLRYFNYFTAFMFTALTDIFNAIMLFSWELRKQIEYSTSKGFLQQS